MKRTIFAAELMKDLGTIHSDKLAEAIWGTINEHVDALTGYDLLDEEKIFKEKCLQDTKTRLESF